VVICPLTKADACTLHPSADAGARVALGRPVATRVRIEAVECSPRQFVYGALAIVGALAARRGVQLEARMPGEMPRVVCDPEATVTVLGDLLARSIRLTPWGGAVRVRVETMARDVRVSVTDTGPGHTVDFTVARAPEPADVLLVPARWTNTARSRPRSRRRSSASCARRTGS
jgi:hypothetical protein